MRLLIRDIFIVLLVEFSRALFLFFFFCLLLTNARQNIDYKYYAT